MRISIIILGAVVALMGSVFSLQGLSIVGPPSSFMYKNPNWITNGVVILAVGLAVVAAGLLIGRSKVSF